MIPFLLVPALVAAPPAVTPEAAVAAVLDDWHLAAAQADEERYFGHMAEGAVFLGTDATERWDKAAFRAYAHPHFAKGRAWSFKAVRRSIALSGDMAWFDEDLDTPSMGPCRGSGVLARRDGAWRILQYNLTVPIPNALMGQVSRAIADHLKGTKARP
ncbi:MAG TPA: nuclear transport factor 2 family protein [Holophaga sp.]|nr:nuclear transport factor 2 family protein [Holophaga sp.]